MHHHHPTTSPHRTLLRCCHCRQLRPSFSPSSSSTSSPSTSATSSPSASPPHHCPTCAHTLCPRCKITFKTRYRECWACGAEEVDIPFRRRRRSEGSDEVEERDGEDEIDGEGSDGGEEICRRCRYPVGPGWVVKWGGAGGERWGEVVALVVGMGMGR
ncbi:hypothetical protein EX30DRAFT_380038 [Ascodesmis nigricans]|uniref:Uncharacterized protein n=1 Tax=Ascodesmis nigricans TaxID=341454 RepID=A0A4V3SIF9_9PEZI|nr:hypothetical protein EX30DRAFT_380038 [Ascodesmis nigricans]